MPEKTPTYSNDPDDVTYVEPANDSSELTLNPNSSTTSSTETTNYEATRIMPHYTEADDSLTNIQLTIGSVVKGTYELIEVLGEGGMGAVYKARNRDWAKVRARNPYVALKVLKPELFDNNDLVEGLFREFDRTKMLSNCPNNIKVHDFGLDGSHVFMSMEYLTGQTLGEYLDHQPMTLTQAWFIIEGVGNALAYAHENNIVHRDIKPGNIFITNEGVVKVLDFGIASKINENEDDKTKFNGEDIGAFTIAYASPETRLGYKPDCRDDIYSFACVVYEILTGKKFYDPNRVTKKAEPIHGLNSKQMDALNKALAFERNQRTRSIREFLDKLRPVKTPWIKYASIGAGVVLVIGLLIHFIPTDTNQDKQTKELTGQGGDSEKEIQIATTEQEAQRVAAEKEAQRIAIEKAAAEQEAQRIATEKAAAEKEARRIATLLANGYSSDEIIHLQTSKPEYKNGEAFHLNFTLTQAMYVRVIDRDVKGNVSKLRPNALQPDKLLPANKEHAFPPKNIDVPVHGITGNNTVTIVASAKPFPKNIQLLNDNGSVSEQVQKGAYSWTQIHYSLRE